MTLSSAVIERLPYVEGVLKYLAPAAAKPMNLAYDPGPGVPRSTGVAGGTGSAHGDGRQAHDL